MVGLWSSIFMFAPLCPTAAPRMRQRASPKCCSRRMAPRVGVRDQLGVGAHLAVPLLIPMSPGVDEQSESSEESEEEKPPEEDKEEEEEKKVPTPQEKKRRKGTWGT